ncbi:MAG: hypothetical protein ACH346_02325 [Chthoniobacterales bacterium]
MSITACKTLINTAPYSLQRFLAALACVLFFSTSGFVWALDGALNPFEPDIVTMKDRSQYKGLIIKNSFNAVTLEQKEGEITLLKKDIARIDDVDNEMIAFTGIVKPGQLPPWKMMVQDFRSNDAIQSFYQIPAARINEGYLKNIPYLSYAVNRFSEFDIFGDPGHPVCIRLGAYAPLLSKKKFQTVARQFFAGYMGSRADIATLYQLNWNGDERRSGNLVFKVTAPSAAGAHHAWWLSIDDPARLTMARVSDDHYKKITIPYFQVRNVIGFLRLDLGNHRSKFLDKMTLHWVGKMPDLQGFYRTSKNRLKLIFSPSMKKRP